jgi:ATP-dependent DNA helicase DinG
MLEEFRRADSAVLFGTDSFWEGVDVPGDALRNVIITRLPFAVPTHPLQEARTQAIRERGGDAFREYSLPQAVLKFKQGFGRLIRTATDTGIVVVLDRRLVKMPYGRQFLAALPDVPVEVR